MKIEASTMDPNPFSTRFIQPGAIEYGFFGKQSIDGLAAAVLAARSPSLICGPHGSGKSTLIASLISEFHRLKGSREIHHVRFSSENRASSAIRCSIKKWSERSVVVLDGYEQISLWSHIWIRWVVVARKLQLIATAHRPIPGFRVIWRTSVDERSSAWILEQLLVSHSHAVSVHQLLDTEAWRESRALHGQNMRESLFDMYDWWHQNQTGSSK